MFRLYFLISFFWEYCQWMREGTVTLRAISKPLMKAASLVKVFERRVNWLNFILSFVSLYFILSFVSLYFILSFVFLFPPFSLHGSISPCLRLAEILPQCFLFKIHSHIWSHSFYQRCPVPRSQCQGRKPFDLCHSEISTDSIVTDRLGKLFNLYILYRSVNTSTLGSFKDQKCLMHLPLFLSWNERVCALSLCALPLCAGLTHYVGQGLRIGWRYTMTLMPTARRPSSKLAFASCFWLFFLTDQLEFYLASTFLFNNELLFPPSLFPQRG